MNIAFIAHDEKKPIMVQLVNEYKEKLLPHTVFATGTTGLKIIEATGLHIKRLKSGPLGGDQQIGAMIAQEQLDFVIFLRDPLTSQPHEPDVNALIRLCDVYDIPLATNIGTARVIINNFFPE